MAMRGDVTIVVIAHRLTTVRNADKIFYIDEARVQGSGKFDSLLKQVPTFKRQVEISGLIYDSTSIKEIDTND